MSTINQASPARHLPGLRLDRRRLLQLGLAGGYTVSGLGIAFGRAGAQDAGTPRRGGSLTVGWVTTNDPKPDGLDPLELHSDLSFAIQDLIYDRVVRLGADGKTIEPGLAATWDVSPDGLTYTFHLRQATFHDGAPITAGDAIFSIERVRERAVITGMQATWNMSAPDGSTLVVRLDRPDRALLPWLADRFTGVLPQHLVESQKQLFFQSPTGSGPFTVANWEPGSQAVLSRYAGYWEPTQPYLDEIRFRHQQDDASAAARLQSGEIDLYPLVAPAQASVLRLDEQVVVIEAPSLSVQAYVINCSRPPYDDPLVRQALNYGIDRQEIIEKVYGGLAEPALGFLPPGVEGYDPRAPGWPYDPDKARALLSSSSAKDGFAGELVVLKGEPVGVPTCNLIAEQLGRIGGQITVVEVTGEEGYARISTNEYDILWSGGVGGSTDPAAATATSVAHTAESTSDAGLSHFSNPEIDALADAAAAMTDPAERAAAYKQMQALVHEDPNWLFLVVAHSLTATSAHVKDLRVSPIGRLRLWEVWRDDV